MLHSFVLCCNFCACKCACTVVVRSPRGGGGGPSLGDRPPGVGGGPSSLGWGRTGGGVRNFLSLVALSESCVFLRTSAAYPPQCFLIRIHGLRGMWVTQWFGNNIVWSMLFGLWACPLARGAGGDGGELSARLGGGGAKGSLCPGH